MSATVQRQWPRVLIGSVGLAWNLMLGGCAMPGGPGAQPWDLDSAARESELELAVRNLNGMGLTKSPTDAIMIVEDLAKRGDIRSQTYLGQSYIYGAPGFPRDPQQGVKWLTLAADQGGTTAKVELAYAYLRGIGVEKDVAKGRALAQAAAATGDADAFTLMGEISAAHLDGSTDAAATLDWLFKAANKMHSKAMRFVGDAYQNGHGVEADKVLAYTWYSLSATAAHFGPDRNASVKSRDDMALLLLPKELELGRQLAAEWKPGQDLAARRRQAASRDAEPTPPPSKPVEAVAVASQPAQHAGDVPMLFRKVSFDVELAENGSYTEVRHIEVQPRNDSAAQEVAQYPIYFDAALQEVEIVEAYTQKADGRKLTVDAASIQTQLVPGQPNVAMFDEQRQKVVLFRNVEAGDLVVFTARLRSQPSFPGHYTFSHAFDQTMGVVDESISISVPLGVTLLTEEHKVAGTKQERNGRRVYEWHYANPTPMLEDNMAVSAFDRNPRIFASTFQNYQQLGKSFASLAADKVAVTPTVQKLADEITAGVTDRRRQAELIHDWVSHHIRYVFVKLGYDGAMIPHPVDTILANGYGDCKDHSALFTALLKAKGIPSQMVLINLGEGFTSPAPPTFALLNHVITWLPEFNLYDDTTLGVAPLGVLSFGEYGKPVVHTSATDPQVRRTPALATGAADTVSRTTARLDSSGVLEGDSEVSGTGPFAIDLRQRVHSMQSQGVEQAAKQFLKWQGIDGTGSFDFESPSGTTAPDYHVKGHFRTVARREWVSGNSFTLPYGLAIGWRPGEDLLGPLDLLDVVGAEATPCYSGREVAELSLELPAGKKIRELPKGIEINNTVLSYKSAWSQEGHTVKLRRELVAKVSAPVCVGEARRLAAKAQNDIRIESHAAVSLVDE